MERSTEPRTEFSGPSFALEQSSLVVDLIALPGGFAPKRTLSPALISFTKFNHVPARQVVSHPTSE